MAKTPEHLASRGVPPLPCPVGTLCPFSAKSHIECPAAEPNLDSSSHPDNYTWERQMQTLYLLLSCVCSHFHSLLHSLSLSVYTLWFLFSVTHQNAQKRLIYTPTHTPGRSSTWVARGGMNAWLIRQYFTVILQVFEGNYRHSPLPNPLVSLLPSVFSPVILSHTHWQAYSVTHSSKTTAQSGRKRRCVRPAPCIPIKMSELWVIFNCARKGTSLKDR